MRTSAGHDARIVLIDGDSETVRLNFAPAGYSYLPFPVSELSPVEPESEPLEKAATFAIQVDAERFLQEARPPSHGEQFSHAFQKEPSQAVRRICECLEACGPLSMSEVGARVGGQRHEVIDALIEAREAGLVKLVDGKYQNVKEA